MIYEFFELLQGVELVFLIPEVQFLQILFDLLTIVQETHFDKIEEEEEIELFALLKPCLIFVEDVH